MRFLAHLRPELIRIAPSWRTFEETAAGLVGALVDAGVVPARDRGHAVDALVAREAEASTALLDIRAGVPHARLGDLARPAVAIAASRAGLYEPVPTVPIQIVALVLSPPEPTSIHLDTLADVATLLRSAELRAGLLATRDGGEALEVLRAHARAMP